MPAVSCTLGSRQWLRLHTRELRKPIAYATLKIIDFLTSEAAEASEAQVAFLTRLMDVIQSKHLACQLPEAFSWWFKPELGLFAAIFEEQQQRQEVLLLLASVL